MNQGSQPFETLFAITARAQLNEIEFYTWGDDQCCLPKGATRATLVDNAVAPFLTVGDLLLFEEIVGPATGFSADANPAHRHVVRLTSVIASIDPLNTQKVIEIAWDAADSLPFPLCLSAVVENQAISKVSVARGNLTLADQGMTEPVETLPDVSASAVPYRPHLQNSGLTFHVAYNDSLARTLAASGILSQDPQQALPDITLRQNGTTWTPVRDLLSSAHNAPNFVAETEDGDTPSLRFGDGILGGKPVSGLQATYRTGNGSSGNVGADAIAHVVPTATSPLTGISDVRNPLPAQGGVDAETLDQVRSFAPWAFRTQERAVTEADYAEVAQRFPEIQRAQATLRWTGSWHTMFITVDRKGGQPVDDAFRTACAIFSSNSGLPATIWKLKHRSLSHSTSPSPFALRQDIFPARSGVRCWICSAVAIYPTAAAVFFILTTSLLDNLFISAKLLLPPCRYPASVGWTPMMFLRYHPIIFGDGGRAPTERPRRVRYPWPVSKLRAWIMTATVLKTAKSIS